MLIKEYRIPLPLTVDEYRIAQLYMIAKKSRDESKGTGSGVEIITNEPYENGPGGEGQYTKKIYHIGSHLPGWFKSILPKSALTVEEEAWNAYPYTKTRYTCPFVDRFSLEIETHYFPDNGFQKNVFQLSDSDLRNRVVDVIDVVKEQVYGTDYLKEEDPKLYISSKTGRGPLAEEWLRDFWAECEGRPMPTTTGKAVMCAYKLCRVEFRYWGMQTKLEKFIHDVALRKTMVRAHRQAWAWQDEWFGLTMEDIREIERKTQEALKAKMDPDTVSQSSAQDGGGDSADGTPDDTPEESSSSKYYSSTLEAIEKTEEFPRKSDGSHKEAERRWSKTSVVGPSAPSPSGSSQGLDLQIANWRMESIRRDSASGSDDEFFDCQEDSAEGSLLAKWSSLDLLAEEDPDTASPTNAPDTQDSIFNTSYLQRVASERGARCSARLTADGVPESPAAHPVCSTSLLVLVLHAGSVLDANVDIAAKKSDVTTFRGAFEAVIRQHYPALLGHVAIRLVPCLSVCTEALGVLSSLSPYSFDVSPFADAPQVTHDSIPIGAIPIFATSNAEYDEAVTRTIQAANSAYQEFLRSPEGKGFTSQVVFIGDSMGSILAYDALCRPGQYNSRHDSENSILDTEFEFQEVDKHLSAPAARRRSSSTSEQSHCKLEMDVSDLFMFGSPLSMVLAYRKVLADDKCAAVAKPGSVQVYNLFHPTDPVAARLEPLLSARFSILPPVNVARYQKYPLGDGQPYHLLEIIQANPEIFSDNGPPSAPCSGIHLRRMSELSIQSSISGMAETLPIHTINSLTQRWWGNKRLDYALYCPEGTANFPTNALPHLFHASYWESSDVIAFILRQVGRFEVPLICQPDKELSSFSPCQPREKWIKKRTSVKLKNMAANHRANDVIVREGMPQKLVARFMYGPLDVIALTGEKVDIHVMKDAPAGEWSQFSTELTDKTGRVTYVIPSERALGYGMYPVKMIVRGDHTVVDMYLAVIPPRTECVVFSIDGSFTASVSVTGRDPKVRAGAVDVVRHWQELGYLIIYITGRPDMQQQKVVSWLSQHNFPHGLISFADGLSTDPLGHKADYLRTLIEDHGVIIHAAYGSSKDIAVYTAIGAKERQIYIVGKVPKKHHSTCCVLSDGYAAHLTSLTAHGGSRPAQGNARMVIPRGYFGLPGQNASLRRRSNDTVGPPGSRPGSVYSKRKLKPSH